MLYEVLVPTGCAPGDIFQVHVNKTVFDITVPEGCGEGSNINLELPLGELSHLQLDDNDPAAVVAPEAAAVEVEVPDGCFPGDEFLVQTQEGQTLTVVVPPGGSPGTRLEVMLPALDAKRSLEVPPDASPTGVEAEWAADASVTDESATSQSDDSTRAGEFDTEDSYLIQRSDGSYSDGWIKEYDESCGLYHVLIIGVGYKWVEREQIEVNTVHF
jgi:hypothetical protein